MFSKHILAAALASVFAWYLFPAPAAADDGIEREVVRLREVVRGIVSELALEQSLDRDGLDDLRDELAQVYRDLDALADKVSWAGGDPGDDGTWQVYRDVSREQYPANAAFDQWHAKADVDLNWGDYGELRLEVVNGSYQAECLIRQAYDGGVQASLRTEANGDIVIKVQDDLGSHEFLVKEGGLGAVYQRGRDDEIPSKQTQPVGSLNGGIEWYAGYRDLVQSGQLGESEAMEWLIDQYQDGEYITADLGRLGDLLRMLPARSSDGDLARLIYHVGRYQNEADFPDPRFNPVGFVHTVNKLFDMYTAGNDFRIEFYKQISD